MSKLVVFYLVVPSLFVLSCIAFGLIYLVRKAIQNRRAIIQLPFNLFRKFTSKANLLIILLSLGFAEGITHILLRIPNGYFESYAQVITPRREHELLLIVAIIFAIYRRLRKNLNNINNSILIWFDKIGIFWFPFFIGLIYFNGLVMFCKAKLSPININNELNIIIINFIFCWLILSAVLRRYKKLKNDMGQPYKGFWQMGGES